MKKRIEEKYSNISGNIAVIDECSLDVFRGQSSIDTVWIDNLENKEPIWNKFYYTS